MNCFPLPGLWNQLHPTAMTIVLEQEWQAAREHILTAMEFVERIFEEEAQEHTRDFVWQMHQVLGRPIIPLQENFLPFEQARAALWLLVTLEKIEVQILNLSKPTGTHTIYDEEKAFDPRLPLLPQVEARVAVEIERHKYRFRQRLDKERQQSIGLTQYVWRTVEDDRVRPEHAANSGKIFAWDDPPETGHPGEDWGCRCTAEPTDAGAELPNDPPIEPVYPIEELLIILTRLKTAYRIGKAIYDRLKGREKKPTETAKNAEKAEKIANGHAWEKHVVKAKEFPEIETKEEFTKHIEDVMNNPDEVKPLKDERTGYWDEKTGTVVIEDPNHPDGGTVFRPRSGKDYFDEKVQ